MGLSQAALANKIGTSTTTIQNYESGSIPTGEYAVKLAIVFDCSIDWLLTGRNHLPEKEDTSLQTDFDASIIHAPAHQECTQQPGRQARHDTGQQDHPQGKITDLITKTIEILESDTVYSGALSANIDAFHEATRTEKKLRELQISVESRFKLMDQRMAALETENKKLKDLLDDSPDNGGSLASNQN